MQFAAAVRRDERKRPAARAAREAKHVMRNA